MNQQQIRQQQFPFQDENQYLVAQKQSATGVAVSRPASATHTTKKQQQQQSNRAPLSAISNNQQLPSLPVFKFDTATVQQQPFAFLSQQGACSILQPWNPFEPQQVLTTITTTTSTTDNDHTMLDSVIDIDSPQDICSCHGYATAIMDVLRADEQKYYPMPDYISKHKDINAHMRAVLVDWLNEVAQEYKLRSDTLYLAVHYTDRFLSLHNASVERSKLQLVGVTCVLIASKYYEAQPPTVDDFVQITDYTYKREELLKMETLVLNTLDFALTGATCIDFLARFVKAGLAPLLLQPQQATSVSMFAHYLCELSLQDYKMLQLRPSKIAASAVLVSLFTHSCSSCWNDTLRHYLAYEQAELQECMQDLGKLHQAVTSKQSPLTAVSDKYSKSKYGRVSLLPLWK